MSANLEDRNTVAHNFPHACLNSRLVRPLMNEHMLDPGAVASSTTTSLVGLHGGQDLACEIKRNDLRRENQRAGQNILVRGLVLIEQHFNQPVTIASPVFILRVFGPAAVMLHKSKDIVFRNKKLRLERHIFCEPCDDKIRAVVGPPVVQQPAPGKACPPSRVAAHSNQYAGSKTTVS